MSRQASPVELKMFLKAKEALEKANIPLEDRFLYIDGKRATKASVELLLKDYDNR